MADFTNDEMLVLRNDYVRDAITPLPLSAYNIAFNRTFFSDAQFNRMKARVEDDRADLLAGVYRDRFNAAMDREDATEENSRAYADRMVQQAVFNLVAAEALTIQIRTDDYLNCALTNAEGRSKVVDVIEAQIEKMRTFPRDRSGGMQQGRLRRR
jgi:hypothetical protein